MSPFIGMSPAVRDSSGVPGVAPPASATTGEIVSRGYDSIRFALEKRRPWAEMSDPSAFSMPESASDAVGRIWKNWRHFCVNYGMIIVAVVAVRLILNPSYLVLFSLLLSGWTYLYYVRTDPVVAFGMTLNETELLLITSLVSVVVALVTGLESLIRSALLLGIGITLLHGAFRVPDNLFLDDQEAPSDLLAFLGSGRTPSPPVSSRV